MPPWNIECIDNSQKRREHENFGHSDHTSQSQSGQDEGEDHRGDLCPDHHTMAVVTVGNDAAERGGQEHGNLAGEAHRPQQKRRSGDPVHEPGLGNTLHPRTDKRNELAGEEELEIAMLERAQCGRQRRLLELRRRRFEFRGVLPRRLQ